MANLGCIHFLWLGLLPQGSCSCSCSCSWFSGAYSELFSPGVGIRVFLTRCGNLVTLCGRPFFLLIWCWWHGITYGTDVFISSSSNVHITIWCVHGWGLWHWHFHKLAIAYGTDIFISSSSNVQIIIWCVPLRAHCCHLMVYPSFSHSAAEPQPFTHQMIMCKLELLLMKTSVL